MPDQSQRWFPNSMPAPIVDAHTHPWWEACAQHRLTVQCCRQCNHAQLPPAPCCSQCNGFDFELINLNGKGELYTYTAVHQAVSPEQTLPFIIAVVELDVSGTPCKNRVRLMTNIVDVKPEELKIGLPVQGVWETMSKYVSIPRFKLLV